MRAQIGIRTWPKRHSNRHRSNFQINHLFDNVSGLTIASPDVSLLNSFFKLLYGRKQGAVMLGTGGVLKLIAALLLAFPGVSGSASAQSAPAYQGTHSPHGNLNVPCQNCHTASAWKPIRAVPEFDHNQTKYPLRGMHQVGHLHSMSREAGVQQCRPTLPGLPCGYSQAPTGRELRAVSHRAGMAGLDSADPAA